MKNLHEIGKKKSIFGDYSKIYKPPVYNQFDGSYYSWDNSFTTAANTAWPTIQTETKVCPVCNFQVVYLVKPGSPPEIIHGEHGAHSVGYSEI